MVKYISVTTPPLLRLPTPPAHRLPPLLHTQALAWTTHLAQQIDLRIEAENLEYFLENFEGQDTDRFATFPKPVRPYVSTCVLVEEFADAHTADDAYLKYD